jgi:hypothetical protein
MRWKLLRRRLSISAPKVIVRSHLPWPLRWAALSLVLGFSAALALWAFDVGKGIAGLEHGAGDELKTLRHEVAILRNEMEKAQSIANTSESLLKMERVVQQKLAQQLRAAETENMVLKGDLGFFERLLPAVGSDRLAIRGLHAETVAAGRLRFQLLVMQAGKAPSEFNGRYDVTLMGMLEGKPWTLPAAGGTKALQLKQYLRVDGVLDHPAQAVVKSVQVRVTDSRGAVRATQALEL